MLNSWNFIRVKSVVNHYTSDYINLTAIEKLIQGIENPLLKFNYACLNLHSSLVHSNGNGSDLLELDWIWNLWLSTFKSKFTEPLNFDCHHMKDILKEYNYLRGMLLANNSRMECRTDLRLGDQFSIYWHLNRPKLPVKDLGICPACDVITFYPTRHQLCSNCEAEQDLSKDT